MNKHSQKAAEEIKNRLHLTECETKEVATIIAAKQLLKEEMTFQELQKTVLGKLQQTGVVEPCCLKLNCNGWIWCKSGKAIDWEYHGLQVCHEAEKLLTEKESVWYLQRLAQVRLRQGEGGMIAVMIDKLAYATYEQRLEALCRVWWPERFV